MRCASRCCAFLLALVFGSPSLAQEGREIVIGSYRFDPAAGLPANIPPGLVEEEPGPGVAHWRILQLNALPDRATQARLRQAFGIELERYVQGGAYIERVVPETVRALEASGLLRSSVLYHPAFKLSPAIGQVSYSTDERRAIPGLLLGAVVFDSADLAMVAQAIGDAGGTDVRVFDDRRNGGSGQVIFQLASAAQLPAVARIDGIADIVEVGEIIEDNVGAATIIQSGVANDDSIWKDGSGLTGKGQIIDVIESGPPDLGHCFFNDPATRAPGSGHRKIELNRHAPGAAAKKHATFVAGSAAGDHFEESGQHPDRGGAWAARLVAGNNTGLTIYPTTTFFAELFAAANVGAYVHSNSWHVQSGIQYDLIAQDLNQFAWELEEHLVVGAISNGGSGSALGPPATAKNALGVSAAQKVNPMLHGSGLSGPIEDRGKPDLMTIGCDVRSAIEGTACSTDVYDMAVSCATSDATPHAAASATLARQYYTEGFYPTGTAQTAHQLAPSGALLKATLLNSTRDMTGVSGYPSNAEGWGIVTLDRTLFFPGSSRHLFAVDARNGSADALALGEEKLHTVAVAGPGEPLKITLVWTDHWSNAALVNDLDLQVTAPDETTTFLGNHFAGGFSASGGAADQVNNVEQVLIDEPSAGSWTIRVKGTGVAVGIQGYALVVTAALGTPDIPNPPTNLRAQ